MQSSYTLIKHTNTEVYKTIIQKIYENFVTSLWLGPVWKTHFSYKPIIKCLEFSFYISLLLNYFYSREIFYPTRLCLQFFCIDLLFLSNIHCLQWHLEVVLTQHKCSLFIQVHCPYLCPPNFLGFSIITINCRASYINANLFCLLTYWSRNCACNSYLLENLENLLGTILGIQYMALICRHLLLMLSIDRDDKLKLPFYFARLQNVLNHFHSACDHSWEKTIS